VVSIHAQVAINADKATVEAVLDAAKRQYGAPLGYRVPNGLSPDPNDPLFGIEVTSWKDASTGIDLYYYPSLKHPSMELVINDLTTEAQRKQWALVHPTLIPSGALAETPLPISIPAILASPSTYQGKLLQFTGSVGTAVPFAQILTVWSGTISIYVNYGGLSAADRERVLGLGTNYPVEVRGRIGSGPAGLEIEATAIR